MKLKFHVQLNWRSDTEALPFMSETSVATKQVLVGDVNILLKNGKP
jgi:hypothetical protein